jgi:phytoene synthase
VTDAATITRRAKSNLAFALRVMPRENRADMVVFYAFCRTLDDLADDPAVPAAQRQAALEAWKHGILHGFENPDTLQRQLLETRDRRLIPNDLLVAIIEGCQMDLQPQRFHTWDDLCGYIAKVSCAVGLVSIRLFGCKDASSERYAVALGRALQLTNILRDVGEDLENGRLYLPLDDLERHGLSEADLTTRVTNGRFMALMEFEAQRALGFFREAAQAVSQSDRKALLPARIMAEIYQRLLHDMRGDGFRVFEKHYHVPALRKLAILARQLLAG